MNMVRHVQFYNVSNLGFSLESPSGVTDVIYYLYIIYISFLKELI